MEEVGGIPVAGAGGAVLTTSGSTVLDPQRLFDQMLRGMENVNTRLLEGVKAHMTEVTETLITRIALNQGWGLKLAASSASTTLVNEMLRRISLASSKDESIPCCSKVEDLPLLRPRLNKYTWQHAETHPTEELAVRYMRYLLQQSKEAVQDALHGEPGSSDVHTVGSYQLGGRAQKRRRESAPGDSEAAESIGAGNAVDDDTLMQAAENAYHVDLIEALRQPRMYRALGLSGPPQRITHASLEDRISSMQLVH
ncbi:hypothetical protein WJX72_008925 [[Myrmecia] bisecta]|uniref:Uncharacterized protein n=1 Tax=[Myrmecia] bisecta TaxID=41462 RepID=A0AAW1Q1M3_9CHLO